MKKLIAILLVAFMCLAILASCTPAETETPDESSTPTEAETPDESSTPESPESSEPQGNESSENDSSESEESSTPTESQYDIQSAMEYLDTLYKKENIVTAADYQLVAQVMVGLDKYVVAWAVDSDKVNAVEGSPYWTIEVDEMSLETVNYKITATVTAPDGTTGTVSYDRTVPKFEVTSFEDYMNAQTGDIVTVAGIVVAINAKSVGNTRNHLFLADVDGKGGYYCYQLDQDPVEAGIEVGMTVAVTAPASPYSGMQETKGGDFVILDKTIKTVEVKDLTDIFATGDIKPYVGLVVTLKGVTIGTQELGGTSEYLKFNLNGKESYIRTYVTDFPTTLKAEDKATIDAAHLANFGNTADVTGVLILYSGNPYLIPVSVDCFSNYTVVTKTDAEKVAAELEELVVSDSITADTTLALPLVGQFYDDVKLAWTVDNTNFVIGEDGKVEIKLASDAVTLKFTVTATCGEATATKEYTVNVAANFVMSTTRPYLPYINQVTAGKVLYLDGGVSGRYLTTTTDASKAVAVYAEKAEGGYKFYILVDGAKQYITIYNSADNKTSVNYDANGTTVFSYNPTVNAFVANFGGKDVYLGTYNSFETISVSNLSYITAENTGVSQFPFELLAVAEGVTYNGFLNQVTAGKLLYLDGGVSGRYLTTTTDASKAVAVFAEKVEGGYKFYILVDGAKQYITIYNSADNKTSVNYDANGTTVFNYDATVNAWVANFGGKDVYLGSYNSFETISVSNLSYITAENTGVSQFPLEFNVAGTTTEGGEGNEGEGGEVVTPPATEVITTIAGALAGAEGAQVELTGTVVDTYSYGNNSVYIQDADGNKILVYSPASASYIGDVVTVSGTLGAYNGVNQVAAGATVVVTTAHTCAFSEATCTAPAICSVCHAINGTALGHDYGEGTACTRCGSAKPSEGATVVGKDDFATLSKNNSYSAEVTTASGWKAVNAAVMVGGTADSNPVFTVFGPDDSTKAITINGKTSAVGKITSPTLSGGLSKITFKYTNCFTESNGVDITINIKQGDTIVASKQLDNNSVTKLTAYDFEWVLETVVTGEFVIEIVNNSPTNSSTSNKDRVSIWNLEWTSAPVAN